MLRNHRYFNVLLHNYLYIPMSCYTTSLQKKRLYGIGIPKNNIYFYYQQKVQLCILAVATILV